MHKVSIKTKRCITTLVYKMIDKSKLIEIDIINDTYY